MALPPGELLDVGHFMAQLRSREPWRAQAACRGAPVRTFFATSTHRAKLLCSECPVRAECSASAVEHHEQGWWGGQSEHTRRRVTST
jgi:WhiB family redox-sensing transcriptional regulator